jgi:hypothetical protein
MSIVRNSFVYHSLYAFVILQTFVDVRSGRACFDIQPTEFLLLYDASSECLNPLSSSNGSRPPRPKSIPTWCHASGCRVSEDLVDQPDAEYTVNMKKEPDDHEYHFAFRYDIIL